MKNKMCSRFHLFIIFIIVLFFVPLKAWAGISISAFPDPAFRTWLTQFDKYGGIGYMNGVPYELWGEEYSDGFLHDREIAEIQTVNVEGTGVSTLEGIKYLTAVENIYCWDNNLQEIDVSGCASLVRIHCHNNQLTKLDVSDCPSLEYLYCWSNQLTSIDVSTNKALKELDAADNKLIVLNVNGCTNLEALNFDNSSMKELDVSDYKSLRKLSCFYNQLTILNISGCTALEELLCYGNAIEKLDLSNKPALKQVKCDGNMLKELDVSSSTKLVHLFCSSNQLKGLDLTKNTALKELNFSNNKLREIDLTANTALTEIFAHDNQLAELNLNDNKNLSTLALSPQNRNGLRASWTTKGYEVILSDYVSNVENIDFSTVRANNNSLKYTEYNYDGQKASVFFPERPTNLNYKYITHSPNGDLMEVTINASFVVDVIERGGPTEIIIGGIEDNHYLNKYAEVLDEWHVYRYSAQKYGRKGFVADGNSRLILRVQTKRPGTVKFELKDDIGVEIERLDDRAKITNSTLVEPSMITENDYQISAVLVAPEMFPALKIFPKDNFDVHVKFTAYETGEEIPENEKEFEEDIRLEIHAAPVLLIHGLGGRTTVENTFAENGNGVLPVLKKAGFNVYSWNYDGTKGPSTLIGGTFDELFCKVFQIFEEYSKKNIVCTKADFVAKGVGGLMAKRFCQPEERLPDGNFYTRRSYGQGVVRRMITIATPYKGTLWGNYMLKDWETLRQGATIGTNRLAYRALKWFGLHKQTGYWYLGDAGIDAIEQSAWEDIAVHPYTGIVDEVYPLNVPMYAIYGRVKDFSEAFSTLKSAATLFFSTFAKTKSQFAQILKLGTRAVKLNIIKQIDSVQAAAVERIAKKIDEIQQRTRDNFISEQAKLYFSGSPEGNLETLFETFGTVERSSKQWDALKQKRLREVLDKYWDLEADVYDTFKELNTVLEESVEGLSLFLSQFNTVIKGVNFQEWDFKIPQWISGAADVFAVAIGGGLELLDAVVEMPFSMMRLFFGDDDYDLFVSASSAAGDFTGASCGFYGWKYRHDKICKQNDVGEEVFYALREYPLSRFKIVQSENSSQTSNLSAKAVSDTANSEDEDDLDFVPDDVFKMNFTLSVDKNIVYVSGDNYAVFTAFTNSQVKSDEVYMSIRDGENAAMIPMTAFDENTFELVIEFTSSDIGLIDAYCLTKTDDNKIYRSEPLQITVVPDFVVKELVSLTSGDAFYMKPDSKILLPLYASTSDGAIFDVSLPSMGAVWTSSNPSIANVSNDGLIHAITNGTAVLTAEYKGLTTSKIVNVGELTAPSIMTDELSVAEILKTYSADLTASGSGPMNWRIISGDLPKGIELSDTGRLSGAAQETGRFRLRVQVSNIAGSNEKEIGLKVKNDAQEYPQITTKSLPNATKNIFYTAEVEGTGGGLVWSALGLPSGLSLNDGIISGIPAEIGDFDVTISALNSYGKVEIVIRLSVIEEEKKHSQDEDNSNIGGKTEPAPDLTNPETNNNATPDNVQKNSGYVEPVKSTSLTNNEIRNIIGDTWNNAPFRSVTTEMEQYDNRTAAEKSNLVMELVGSQDVKYVYVLMPMKPVNSGIFTFDLPLPADMEIGDKLIWSVKRSLAVASVNTSDYKNRAVFIDSATKKETEIVPESRAVSVSTYLEAGYTYEPVVMTAANENASFNSSNSSGGGCNGISLGFLTLILVLKAGSRKHF